MAGDGTLTERASFYAYNPAFTGGVFVASAQLPAGREAGRIAGARIGATSITDVQHLAKTTSDCLVIVARRREADRVRLRGPPSIGSPSGDDEFAHASPGVPVHRQRLWEDHTVQRYPVPTRLSGSAGDRQRRIARTHCSVHPSADVTRAVSSPSRATRWGSTG
jgi:hypothetical protein